MLGFSWLGSRAPIGLLAGLQLLICPSAEAGDGRRVALLIGNSAYVATSGLPNPVNDVAAMKLALEGAGFDSVDAVVDLSRRDFIEALNAFEDKAAGADVGVIFYAGHGLEMDGQNYLVPVDAKLASARDVPDEGVSLDRLLLTLDSVKGFRLVILDACRNNPLAATMRTAGGKRSIGRGLAREEPEAANTLIAYAAKAGAEAADGSGDNSPYTQALAQYLVEPGLDVRIALGKVRDAVYSATRGAQEPYVSGSMGGATVMLGKADMPGGLPAGGAPASAAPANPAAPADRCTDAAAHWAQAEKFDRAELYEEHLELFASCSYASFARLKIEQKKVAVLTASPSDAGRSDLLDADLAGPQVIKVRGKNGDVFVVGTFRRTGPLQWVERNTQNGAIEMHFTTVKQSKNLIIIYDRSRDLYLQMDLAGRRIAWKQGEATNWNPLYRIDGVD